jgi:hypothetical protein
MLRRILLLLALAGIPLASYTQVLPIPLSAAYRLAGELEKERNIWFEVQWETFPTVELRQAQAGSSGDPYIEMILTIKFVCKTGKVLIQPLGFSLLRKRGRFRRAAAVDLRMPKVECREGEQRVDLKGGKLTLEGPTVSAPFTVRAYGYLRQGYSIGEDHFLRLTSYALDQEPYSFDLRWNGPLIPGKAVLFKMPPLTHKMIW